MMDDIQNQNGQTTPPEPENLNPPAPEPTPQPAPSEPPRNPPPPPYSQDYYNPGPSQPWQGGQYPPPGNHYPPSYQPWPNQNTTGWQPAPDPWQTPRPQQPGYQRNSAPPPPAKKHRGLRIFSIVLGVVALLALLSFAGYGIYVATTGQNPFANTAPASQPNNSVPDVPLNDKPFGVVDDYAGGVSGSLSFTEIYKKVSPSVVGVIAYYTDSVYGGESQGSGIIMDETGYIITNAHVVADCVKVEVVLTNGDSYPADVVGYDIQSDLAVLKVAVTGLTYAEFGDSTQLEIGERVCAIGNPAGLLLQSSLTGGYVSALNRTISTGGYALKCIQTDASINPGNSGGPLINAFGQVVGINSAKIIDTDYEGIGFAIPITDAMPILQQLIANGKITGRALLGVTVRPVTAADAEYFGTPLGLSVAATNPGADITAKGVRPGDIITHINGRPVYTMDDCSTILRDKKPGDTVTVTIFRRQNNTRDDTFHIEVILSAS